MSALQLGPPALRRMKAGGLWVPSPLALDERLRMLPERQRLLTLYYIRSGARTVVPGAHTGEFAGRDTALLGRWLSIVAGTVREYGRGMFLMAAVGGPDVMAQAELAARAGYDIAMVAPTAFAGMDDAEALALLGRIADIIPTFGFELQRAIPGAREFSDEFWDGLFEITYGAKGASFDTYRAQSMLAAAARSPRRADLVLATGNDDRIVHDLGGLFPFRVGGREVVLRYYAGLLGHFATDTHAAAEWSSAVTAARDSSAPALPQSERRLAHLVNLCNGALFDALGGFENSVWGVKCRLSQLGLLEAPWCYHESGRAGQAEAIRAAYHACPLLNDDRWVAEHLDQWRRELGMRR